MQSIPLHPRRYAGLIGLFFLLFLATLVVTPLIGSTSINLGKAFSRTLPFEDNVDANILFLARLPRIFLGAVTGAALSVAGAVFQALLRNDLAAPFTLGVSSGAALGAVIAIVLGFEGYFFGFSLLPVTAFLGALGAVFLVFGLAKSRGKEFSTSTLLLAGITANFFFAALVMFIHYLADFTQSFLIIRWLMGGLDITSYRTVFSILVPVLLGIGVLLTLARSMNLISAGDESAASRGVEVARTQIVCFVTASLITGSVVSISGPIGFVGLIVPHIVRLMVGPDLRILIPASMFFGASFLIACDTVARTLLAPTEIPVGIITALIGGPFFVWLLKRQR